MDDVEKSSWEWVAVLRSDDGDVDFVSGLLIGLFLGFVFLFSRGFNDSLDYSLSVLAAFVIQSGVLGLLLENDVALWFGMAWAFVSTFALVYFLSVLA